VHVLPTISKGEIVEQGVAVVLLLLSTYSMGPNWYNSELFSSCTKVFNDVKDVFDA